MDVGIAVNSTESNLIVYTIQTSLGLGNAMTRICMFFIWGIGAPLCTAHLVRLAPPHSPLGFSTLIYSLGFLSNNNRNRQSSFFFFFLFFICSHNLLNDDLSVFFFINLFIYYLSIKFFKSYMIL